jgi:hypothetical protein
MTYVLFGLACITAYFAVFFSVWLFFSFFFLYMCWFTWEHNQHIAIAEKARLEQEREQSRILNHSIIEEERNEMDKKENRGNNLWNVFGWSTLIILAFVSSSLCFLFFFLGGLFFSWGDFLYRPLKDFF